MTKDEAVSLFEYKDGDLYWKVDRGNRKTKGKLCGQVNNHGYRFTRYKGKTILNHRIIFLMHHGYLPKTIDHVDGNPANNRIENLRECTMSQNQYNRKTDARSKLGLRNIQFHNRDQGYVVRFRLKGKTHCFGAYKDLELAQLVADEFINNHHKEFTRL